MRKNALCICTCQDCPRFLPLINLVSDLCTVLVNCSLKLLKSLLDCEKAYHGRMRKRYMQTYYINLMYKRHLQTSNASNVMNQRSNPNHIFLVGTACVAGSSFYQQHSQGLNKSMGISAVAPYSMLGVGKISEIYSHVIPFTGYARVQRDI